jgi:hypothetical protein
MLRPRRFLFVVAPYLPAAAILSGVIAVQTFALPGNDVAWLLTLAEKLLAGARPDVDFIEFNPPASYLIYVPAAAIGRVFGVKSDFVLIALTALATVCSICAAGSILARARLMNVEDRPAMITGALVALLVFADSSFAQREHLAVLALLPMLAVYASRAAVTTPGNLAAILSGVAGGLGICIKPYFGFALAVPLVYCAWRARDSARGVLRLLFSSENLSAVAVVATYAVTVAFFFTDYVRHTLPIVLAVYVPVREPLHAILTGIRFVTFLLMFGAAVVVGGSNVSRPLPAVLFLAASGFLLAMFAQARVWFYQGYPALALMMIATVWLAVQRARRLSETQGMKRTVSSAIIVVGLIPSLGTLFTTHVAWYGETMSRIRLTEGIRSIVPDRPKVIAISRKYAFVPVARRLDGTWVGRTYFQAITSNVDEQLAGGHLDAPARDKLEAYAGYDAEILASDIISQKPDVIIVHGADDRGWALSEPAVRGALRNYHEVGGVERVFVWVPR